MTVPAQAAGSSTLQDSGLENLELTDDYLTNAADKEHEYLRSLSSEKFLYEWYRNVGLTPTTDSGYGGWERSDVTNFRGHAFGHYMSALAQSYSATSDETTRAALLAQIEDAVAGLTLVQDTNAAAHPDSAGYVSAFPESALDAVDGTGTTTDKVLVPWYILHKVLAGLLDIHEYVGGETGDEALDVAEQFGEYVYQRISGLADKTVMLRTEYGGMNDALYELYDVTDDAHFKTAAEAFDETALFDQLAAGTDVLSGKHANTTIPKLIGALKRYTVLTQDPEKLATLTAAEVADLESYRDAAENFWQIVVDHHTYVTGSNSQSEHFHDPDSLYEFATQQGETGDAQTAETCNEYNMLKLSRELFKLTKDVKYADYYENTFLNTVLASQNPDTGMTTYFQPMAAGYDRVYSLPFTEFWCCTGTGMESFSKLGDSIWFTDRRSVWVTMFLSSAFEYADQNVRLEQEADLPTDDTVTFHVSAIDGDEVAEGTTLRLRVPDWIVGDPTVTVNGETIAPQVEGGFVVLADVAAGDEITYRMPMKVAAVPMPDNATYVAFRYGPVVLSTSSGRGTSGRRRASAWRCASRASTRLRRAPSRWPTARPSSGSRTSRTTSCGSTTPPTARCGSRCATSPTARTSSSRRTTAATTSATACTCTSSRRTPRRRRSGSSRPSARCATRRRRSTASSTSTTTTSRRTRACGPVGPGRRRWACGTAGSTATPTGRAAGSATTCSSTRTRRRTTCACATTAATSAGRSAST